MKIGTGTCFDYDIPLDRSIPMIRQAGFDVLALGSLNNHPDCATKKDRSRIKKLIEENDLELDSVHAPEAGWWLFSLDETERLESVRQCKIAIDAASDLGAGVVVVHSGPGNPDVNTRTRIIRNGIESIKDISMYALDKGVKLAIENTTYGACATPVLECVLNEFSNDILGFCYDTGHEQFGHEDTNWTCFRILERSAGRLLTTHIHDSRGHDEHLLPYEGNINWDRFREVFHSFDYSGHLVLEAMIRKSQFKNPEIFLVEGRKRAEMLLQLPKARAQHLHGQE